MCQLKYIQWKKQKHHTVGRENCWTVCNDELLKIWIGDVRVSHKFYEDELGHMKRNWQFRIALVRENRRNFYS